jgi:hypothetical protein
MQPSEPASKPIDIADVLAVFRGAKIIAVDKPLSCKHCDKDSTPAWRRGGKIVEWIWPDRREWACHYCGRAQKGKRVNGQA